MLCLVLYLMLYEFSDPKQGQFLPGGQICDLDATKKVKSLILEIRTKSTFDSSSIQ